MNCFGRKYQRSLRVVRHKGCWILKSYFQHPLQGCYFGAATAFETSPAFWSTTGVLFSSLQPCFLQHWCWKWVQSRGDVRAGILAVLGITGSRWYCACIWVAVPQMSVACTNAGLCSPCRRAFPVVWSPSSLWCAQLWHASNKTPAGPGSWGLGWFFFSGQCYLEMDGLLVIFSRQVPDFKMIAKFIASPPPFYCPRSGDLWGFALLCKGEAWLRPAFPLGERILWWRLLFGVCTATSSPVLPLIY